MSKIRILQIGDLHRGKSSGVRNGPLLDSLLTDLKYQLNTLLPIDIVAVCGDLVQGTSEQTIESVEQLAAQYSEAEEFLIALADELLGGKRDRVVIVPGNHDVSWPHSYSSMRKIEADVANAGKKILIDSLVKESRRPSSATRWSWEELRFLEISDKNLYSERMSSFRTFYNSFYNGLSSYDLDPECQYAIHDFGDLSVVTLALNSCDCLDHCNHTAHINPNALAKALIKLKRQEFVGRTKIAIWHHGLAGEPNRVDYLDPLAV
jgi:predicted MPP superfamily phosphohydrolase